MPQDNTSIIRRFVDEVITRSNVDSAADFAWEDVVEQVRSRPGPRTRWPQRYPSRHARAFPDLRLLDLEQIAEADKSGQPLRGPALTRAPFLGVPPPGRSSAYGRSSSIASNRAASKTRASSWTSSVSCCSWAPFHPPPPEHPE